MAADRGDRSSISRGREIIAPQMPSIGVYHASARTAYAVAASSMNFPASDESHEALRVRRHSGPAPFPTAAADLETVIV